MQNYLLSIIIPFYNVEKYIHDCLKCLSIESSIIIEIILVNDGSTDNSENIVEKFIAGSFQNFVFIYLKQKNKGLSSARNAGLNVARGKYISFIDSDDVFDLNIMLEMVFEAEFFNADIVVADYYEFSENLKNKYKLRLDKSFIPEKIMSNRESKMNKLFNIDISFSVWNKIYKHSFLNQNKLNFLDGFHFEDLDFTFKAFFYSGIILKYNGVVYGYRQRTDSIMKDISPKILDKISIMESHKYFLQQQNCFQVMKSDYYYLYLKIHASILYAALINKGDKKSKNYILCELFKYKRINEIINEINLKKISFKFLIYIIFLKLILINKNAIKFFV